LPGRGTTQCKEVRKVEAKKRSGKNASTREGYLSHEFKVKKRLGRDDKRIENCFTKREVKGSQDMFFQGLGKEKAPSQVRCAGEEKKGLG